MNSLKSIFDKQIEQFRDLKVQFDQIKHDQESFNYDWKLSDLEQEKDKLLEEVEKNEILRDSVKKAACDAIEYEFLGKLEKLEAEYAKFWELLATVLSERIELRSDPQYQKAIKVRSMALHAKLNTEKLKLDRDSANDQTAAAKDRYEQAKKALELAEHELEWSKKTLKSAKEALRLSKKTQEEVETIYNEKIKDVIFIQEKIINLIISYITNGLDINEKDLTRSLDSIVKSKIYYSSWIWPKWGWLEDIESMVSIESFDNASLKAWDSVFVNCTFWTWDDKLTEKINIRIVWDTTKDTNDNVETSGNTSGNPDENELENTDWNPVSWHDDIEKPTDDPNTLEWEIDGSKESSDAWSERILSSDDLKRVCNAIEYYVDNWMIIKNCESIENIVSKIKSKIFCRSGISRHNWNLKDFLENSTNYLSVSTINIPTDFKVCDKFFVSCACEWFSKEIEVKIISTKENDEEKELDLPEYIIQSIPTISEKINEACNGDSLAIQKYIDTFFMLRKIWYQSLIYSKFEDPKEYKKRLNWNFYFSEQQKILHQYPWLSNVTKNYLKKIVDDLTDLKKNSDTDLVLRQLNTLKNKLLPNN